MFAMVYRKYGFNLTGIRFKKYRYGTFLMTSRGMVQAGEAILILATNHGG